MVQIKEQAAGKKDVKKLMVQLPGGNTFVPYWITNPMTYLLVLRQKYGTLSGLAFQSTHYRSFRR